MGKGKTYEMQWDCEYCGSKRLLGKTHRHCPNCGAPQDPRRRTFPPDDEKVAVEDHVFVGADLACPACAFPNAKASAHCGRCGSPLAEGAEVARRADGVDAVPPAPKAGGKGRLIWGFVGFLAALALAGLLFGLVSKQEAVFTVAGHEWERRIEIERLARIREAAWCDALPADAEDIRRRREVRSKEKVQVGEDCRTRKVDNGDGTFTERQDCTPRYKEEPVYDEKCSYKVVRWQPVRTLQQTGDHLDDAPRWPVVELMKSGESIGSEREGRRTERYTVHLVDDGDGDSEGCAFDETRWRGFASGSHWAGQVARIGGLDCESLVAPRK